MQIDNEEASGYSTLPSVIRINGAIKKLISSKSSKSDQEEESQTNIIELVGDSNGITQWPSEANNIIRNPIENMMTTAKYTPKEFWMGRSSYGRRLGELSDYKTAIYVWQDLPMSTILCGID